jgi:succinate-semialdehyde dehydrogenase/glutarate-semialdehyde dehydrogenase
MKLHRPDLLREASFVEGRWLKGDGWLDVINPATGQVLGQVATVGAEGTRDAVDAAARAMPAWAALTAAQRGTVLRRWADLMRANADDLAQLLTAEQGKPLAEARGEIDYAASFLDWFAEEARRAYGTVIPGHQADKRLTVIRQPVGIVAAITPWNFPAAMVTRKVAPALAVGCTVVLKPSELTPLSALALGLLAAEAGVPPGVFNIVVGAPATI